MEQEFYFLHTKDGYAKAIYEETAYERRKCKKCSGIHIIHLENVNVSFRGSRKGNYYTIPGGHFMIDSKLKALFQENQVTGYELKDITFVGSHGFCEDGIQEMVITGRAGHLQKVSGEEFGSCELCGRITENFSGMTGAGFDMSKWDKTDIFLCDNFIGIPIITQRVKDLLEKNKIKNVSFTNIKDEEFI